MTKYTTTYTPKNFKKILQNILDNNCSPLLKVIDLDDENGFSLYDISPKAVRDLRINKDGITFLASFNGIPKKIAVFKTDIISLKAESNGTK